MGADPATVRRIDLCSHRASARSTWTVVRVESAAGVVGLGECSDGGDPAVLDDAVDAARTTLVGAPVDGDRAALRGLLCDRRAAAGRAAGLAWSTALGGLESALDDLCARHAGVGLAGWLGVSTPERVRLYANLNRAWGDRPVGELVAAACAAAAEGFPAVKIAPFGAGHGDADKVVAAGLSVVDAVRDALPDRTGLMVDCHFRLDDRALRTALPELAAREVVWVEDAVDPRDLDRLRRLRDDTPVPLATGEHEWDPAVVAAACGARAVDFWLVDPKHAGGPRATRRLLDLTGDVSVSYHNPSGPVGTVHAAHLSGLSPRLTWLEYAWGVPGRADHLSPAETVADGTLVVPPGPGIGVDLATTNGAVRT